MTMIYVLYLNELIDNVGRPTLPKRFYETICKFDHLLPFSKYDPVANGIIGTAAKINVRD